MIKKLEQRENGKISIYSRRLTKGLSTALLWSLLCSFLSFPYCANAIIGNLQFTHLLTEDGHGIGPVESILKDHNGFMWFAGLQGLVRYDGYTYLTFRHDPEKSDTLSSNVVWDIFEDSQKQIWIATDAGLNKFNQETHTFTRYTHQTEKSNSVVSNSTRSITEDRNGYLWIATLEGLSRLSPDRKTFKNFYNEEKSIAPPPRENTHKSTILASNILQKAYVDQYNTLWIGSGNAGFFSLNQTTLEFTHYRDLPTATDLKSHRSIKEFVRIANILWIATDGGGLYQYNLTTQDYKQFSQSDNNANSLSNDQIIDMQADDEGHLWLVTEEGLNIFNTQTYDVKKYLHVDDEPTSLNSPVLHSVYIDDNKDIWLGAFPTGVNFLDTSNIAFKTFHSMGKTDEDVNITSVLAIEEISDPQEKARYGQLWIGTDGGGLSYYHPKKKGFELYGKQSDHAQLSSQSVLSIKHNDEGKLLAGTWRGGINEINLKTGENSILTYQRDTPNQLRSENTWDLAQDQDGNTWVATVGGGINKQDKTTGLFNFYNHPYNSDSPTFDVAWKVFIDSLGRVWGGTSEGLARYLPEEDGFKLYQHDPNNPKSLRFNTVLDIKEDANNQLWIATRGGGVNHFDPETEQFTAITKKDGLPTDIIDALEIDDNGDIWLASAKGLTHYIPSSKRIIHYTDKNGLQSNQFNIGASTKLRSGELVFGGIRGFTRFHPNQLQPNTIIPQVAIVNFQIFNRPVPIGEDSPLHKAIDQTTHITLTYDQSVFSFDFVALNYRSPENNQFAFIMEGFENQWNYVDASRRSATYTNLSPGQYTFRVKASNNQGLWNEKGASIKITVLPPPWRTWWAYSLYLLTVFALIGLFIYSQHRKVLAERKISQRLQQLDKIKDNFLAKTSHELRTPLNGIIGIAESLLQGAGGPQSDVASHNLRMISSSGRRLERLVNAILDFSKLKEDAIHLNKKPLDLHSLTQVVIALSHPSLGTNEVKLQNDVPANTPAIYADEDRVLQILHNLVGNAMKYTSQGTISIGAKTHKNNMLSINVSDTGIGIPEDKIGTIFNDFEQLDIVENQHGAGTGLGLAIAKQLVELHGGKIWVESTPETGTSMIFTLPLSRVSISEKSINPTSHTPPNNQCVLTKADKTQTKTKQKEPIHPTIFIAEDKDDTHDDNRRFCILIADDDPINRQVLINHLSLRHYQIEIATNGKETLEAVEEKNIDLLLLDVMMPGVSGYDVCKRLRKTYASHDLPIIFLTAKSHTEDVVTGFNVGANDFLTKPINRDEMLARVKTHLQLLESTRDLENKIDERTAELQKKNEQLEGAYCQLEEISLSDPLTGLNNRRYLQKLLSMDSAKVERTFLGTKRIDNRDLDVEKTHKDTTASTHNTAMGAHQTPFNTPLSADQAFLILDIDHFKSVNDKYGHLAGDQLLVQFADLLQQILRESDCAVRWGGEEFLIVGRFSDRDEIPAFAERLRRTIEEHTFDIDEHLQLKKTCSIGYASYPFIPERPDLLSWEHVIHIADKALYGAKHSGRNRCVGLSANNNTPSKNLHEQISQNLDVLIQENKLRVIAHNPAIIEWQAAISDAQ